MATLQARQPFAALDESRLQRLTSVKNCQNAISNLSSPSMKQHSFASPGKRSFTAAALDEEHNSDAENVDPASFNSPSSKRSKNVDGTPAKPKFTLTTTTAPRPLLSPVKKPLSLSLPTTTTTTPISASRGSPKHKRIGLLSKNRRASSSPFRRVDPPSFSIPSAGGLPFSIDEALKGTISTYKPKPAAPEMQAESQHMPKGWFFDIHVDTPDEEAANLMQHSASTLDISSDDDAETRRRSEDRERGKENVPPPSDLANMPATADLAAAHDMSAAPSASSNAAAKKAARRARKDLDLDAMLTDRAPLADLDAADFFADGLDAASSVVVPADNAFSPHKPSALAKECFDFAVPASPAAKLEAAAKKKAEDLTTLLELDTQSKEIFICED